MIKFIREYDFYGTKIYDVIYKSNRCRIFTESSLLKTAREFIRSASLIMEQEDKTFHRIELIYQHV